MKFRLSENGDLNYCFIYLFSIELKPLNLGYPGWHATTTELWETQVKLYKNVILYNVRLIQVYTFLNFL